MKKTLSLLLAFLMIFSVLPISAFAADNEVDLDVESLFSSESNKIGTWSNDDAGTFDLYYTHIDKDIETLLNKS